MTGHTEDCALVQYASIPPNQLKAPLVCDCDGPGADDDAPEYAGHSPATWRAEQNAGGPTETLHGTQARALKAYRAAESAYRAARERRDKALSELTEELLK